MLHVCHSSRLRYYWTNNKVLLQKCPVNFTVHIFLWEYWDHSTAVFQKWSIALTVRILWAVNTYCTPNRARCSMQWSISWRLIFSVLHPLLINIPIQ